MTSRRELEGRVDELAAVYTGHDFAAAVRRLHDELDPDDRETLQAIVLERAANLDDAVMDRVDARGWFRRQWDRAGRLPRDRERKG